MIILHDEATLLHETVELLGSKVRPALESPERIKAVVASIRDAQTHDLRIISTSPEVQSATLELAKATHAPDYLAHLQSIFPQWHSQGLVESHESVLPECFRLYSATTSHKALPPPKDIYAQAGYYAFDMSTGITQHSWTSIIASANLAIQAAKLISPSPSDQPASPTGDKPQPRSVLALTRPPGHHCTGTQAGGYCYINNIVLSITQLRLHHHHHNQTQQPPPPPPPRFAILDLDYHHGNGTQELTYSDPEILYVSIHGANEYPYYTGSPSETGPPPPHPASNTNLNLPLSPNTSFTTYLATLSTALTAITHFNPDYLLISLGFDTFHLDPLGKFDIDTPDYGVMAARVRGVVRDVPALILLEGGYVVERLGENLGAFLGGWEGVENGDWDGKGGSRG